MQPALQETYEETSGIYKITLEGPVAVPGLHNWLPSLTRRGALAGYVESLLVAVAIVGFMGLTALLASAHYDSVRSAPTIAEQLTP